MSDNNFPYLHGFSQTEQERLRKQSRLTEQLIYKDIDFSSCEKILEVGCGVGAQTEILLRRFPSLHIQGIDLNKKQIETAQNHLSKLGFGNGRWGVERMDAAKTRFKPNSFDGAFLCWVLEHVPDPNRILGELRRVLRRGAQVYITEVMNSSFFLDPYSPHVWKYWMAFNDFQYAHSGDPFVGAKLGNLLSSAGYEDIETKVKTFHFDNRDPQKRKEMVDFWCELLNSAADQLIGSEYVDSDLVKEMKRELDQISHDPNAVFHYSFMQAKARV